MRVRPANSIPNIYRQVRKYNYIRPYRKNKIHIILPNSKAFVYNFKSHLKKMGVFIPRKVSLDVYV